MFAWIIKEQSFWKSDGNSKLLPWDDWSISSKVFNGIGIQLLKLGTTYIISGSFIVYFGYSTSTLSGSTKVTFSDVIHEILYVAGGNV